MRLLKVSPLILSMLPYWPRVLPPSTGASSCTLIYLRAVKGALDRAAKEEDMSARKSNT